MKFLAILQPRDHHSTFGLYLHCYSSFGLYHYSISIRPQSRIVHCNFVPTSFPPPCVIA